MPCARTIDTVYAPLSPPNISVISVVTIGELLALAYRLGWGGGKRERLAHLVRGHPFVDISRRPIMERYAEIDAYSKGKHPERPAPPGMASRTMGKNDLWIAATASVLGYTLLTLDHDFDHLDGVFLKTVFINPAPAGH